MQSAREALAGGSGMEKSEDTEEDIDTGFEDNVDEVLLEHLESLRLSDNHCEHGGIA